MAISLKIKSLLRKYWKDALIIVVVISAITAWQQRNLLADQQLAPNFLLTQLDTSSIQPLLENNKPTLLYFFAPWCSICKLSIGNLSAVNKDVNVVAIALDYRSIEEVREFIDNRELGIPVLLGNSKVSQAYRISAFPTYYVIDSQGEVIQKSVGYSSALGLLWRSS